MRLSFAWVAPALGLILALVLLRSGALAPAGERSLPLLTLLIVSEFGFFLTAIGAGAAGRSIMARGFSAAMAVALAVSAAMAGGFLWLGLRLWPEAGA